MPSLKLQTQKPQDEVRSCRGRREWVHDYGSVRMIAEHLGLQDINVEELTNLRGASVEFIKEITVMPARKTLAISY
ncbi:MAG: hypothetical protein J7K68_00095 [Candidatus Diapherotrites archaeon]|nr:hypothetical protein [Candidatus Diapherotrites archaeon]